jgi:hypothetical protein
MFFIQVHCTTTTITITTRPKNAADPSKMR